MRLISWNSIAVMMITALAQMAHADLHHFSCTSVDQDTRIEVSFEDAKDDRGHRATTMALYDLNVSLERQSIASFQATDGLLNNSGGVVIAYVDLSNPNSSRRGERVGGTVLGALRSIVLDIDFSYQEVVQGPRGKKGTGLAANVTYMKRNGEELVQDFDCVAD